MSTMLSQELVTSIINLLPINTVFRLSLCNRDYFQGRVTGSVETLFNDIQGTNMTEECGNFVLAHPGAFSSVKKLHLPHCGDNEKYYAMNLLFLSKYGPQITDFSLYVDTSIDSKLRCATIDLLKTESITRLKLVGIQEVFYKHLFGCNWRNLTELECPLTEKIAELSSTTGALRTPRLHINFRQDLGYFRRASDIGRRACARLTQLLQANPSIELLSIKMTREKFDLLLQHLIAKFDKALDTGVGLLDRIEMLLVPAPKLRFNGCDLFTISMLSFRDKKYPAEFFEDAFKRTFEVAHSPEECMQSLLAIGDEIKTQLDERHISAAENITDEKLHAYDAIFKKLKGLLADPHHLDLLLRAPFMIGTLCAYVEASNEDDDELSSFWWNQLSDNVKKLPDEIAATFFDGYKRYIHPKFHFFCVSHSEMALKIGYYRELIRKRDWMEELPTGLCAKLLAHPDFDVVDVFQGPRGGYDLLRFLRQILEDAFDIDEETIPPLLEALRMVSEKGLVSEQFVGVSAYSQRNHWLLEHSDDRDISEARRLVFKVFPRLSRQVRAFHVKDWYCKCGNSFEFFLFVRAATITRYPSELLSLDTALWIAVLQIVENLQDPSEQTDLVVKVWNIAVPTASFEKLLESPDKFFQKQYDHYSAKTVRTVQTIIREVRQANAELPEPAPATTSEEIEIEEPVFSADFHPME